MALVINLGRDYHWYRQDSDGTWSHKPGRSNVSGNDSESMPILDPEYANRHNSLKNNYYIFAGFYAVTPIQ